VLLAASISTPIPSPATVLWRYFLKDQQQEQGGIYLRK